jgi:exo-1,4-beta-D-glucosaminidase
VNGQLLSSAVGTFRSFAVDITPVAAAGINAVAVEITRPFDRALPSTNHDTDLAISFVDWSPAPPDGNMGLWRAVVLDQHSALSLSTPSLTALPRAPSPPSPAAPCDVAVTIIVDASNHAASPALAAHLSCTLSLADGRRIVVTQQVTLPSSSSQRMTFTPRDFPQLLLPAAALWWPWQMGDATLNDLTCSLQSQHDPAPCVSPFPLCIFVTLWQVHRVCRRRPALGELQSRLQWQPPLQRQRTLNPHQVRRCSAHHVV